MDSSKMNFGEGASINRPPSFNGENYGYWKERMTIFIESIGIDIWDAIENGPYIPMKVEGEKQVEKPRSEWTDEDKKRAQPNFRAKNLITSALSYSEFFRVSNCKSAKEMWDTLRVTHEGTSEVKRSRMNSLMHEYELFAMHANEPIEKMQLRFTHIINHLLSLGKSFSNGDLVNKILRCLTREWQPKVTAIMESRDLDQLDIATLFGKLKEHEQELHRLQSNEENDKKKRGLALKTMVKEESDSNESNDENDAQMMNLLAKKFTKFLRNGNNKFHKKKGVKKSESSPRSIICFECGKAGHIKSECPTLKKDKGEKKGKKTFRKKAYIAWEDNDISSTSSSSSSEDEANLCLMSNLDKEDTQSEVSTSSDDSSDDEPSIDELRVAFGELYDKSIELTKKTDMQKKMIMSLEDKIACLLEEISELKLENETLDLLNKIPLIDNPCDTCVLKDDKIKELQCVVDKFTNASHNLDMCLSAQKNAFDRSGIGYDMNNDSLTSKCDNMHDHCKKSLIHKNGMCINACNKTGLGFNVGSSSHVKASKNAYASNNMYATKRVVASRNGTFVNNRYANNAYVLNRPRMYARKYVCHYCGLDGHLSTYCYAKLYHVPKGRLIWVPKRNQANP